MVLSVEYLRTGLDHLARQDADVRAWLARADYPQPRVRKPGYETLLRTLVGQQLSVRAAASIYEKLKTHLGETDDPARLLAASDEALRAAGLSRQKIGYARALAQAVRSGQLNFDALPHMPDEEAIAMLSSVKGFGRWSAEIYLMFAEGRPDILPANDLGVQEGTKRILNLAERPREKDMRSIGARYTPYRTAFALFSWHVYAYTAAQDKATL